MKKNSKFKSGQVMIICIITLVVVLILCATLFSRVAAYLHFGSNAILSEETGHLAEAGVDFALWQLNKNAGICPAESCGPTQTVGTTGTFIVRVQNKTSSLQAITSTGYIPNSQNPRAKRTIKVDALIRGQSIAFPYAVQTGDGGIMMALSSEIQGSAYSNADIQSTGPSTIDGDAYAFGIVHSPPVVNGEIYNNSDKKPMPIKNIQDFYSYWKNAANVNNDPIIGDQTYNAITTSLGPREIQGNLTITNQAKVTINGPIYVTGNLTVSQHAEVKLNDDFGSIGTVIIVDGTVTVSQNGSFTPTISSPKGYILVVTTASASPAITVSNMGALAIFYTQDGGTLLKGITEISALVTKSLTMQIASRLIYDQDLTSTQFAASSGGSWQIKKGTYRFTSSP